MKKKIIFILLLTAVALFSFTGCADENRAYQVIKKDIMLKNEEGTYTKAQVLAPSDFEEKSYPLVTLSHGFRGSMDTAGGETLAENLAKAGFATIRMNYSHFTDQEKDEQTDQYTVETMISDQAPLHRLHDKKLSCRSKENRFIWQKPGRQSCHDYGK